MKRWILTILALVLVPGCVHRQVLCPAERCGQPAWSAQTHATFLATANPPTDPLKRSGSERAIDYIVRTLRHYGMEPERVDDDILVTLPGSSPSAPPLLLIGAHGTSALAALQTSCDGREDSIGVAILLETARALRHQTSRRTRTVHFALLGGPSHSLEHRIRRAHEHFNATDQKTNAVGHTCHWSTDVEEELAALHDEVKFGVIPTHAGHLRSRQSPPALPALVESLLDQATAASSESQ